MTDPRNVAAVVESTLELSQAESPLFGVAMLKIAMELKKQRARGLEDILRGVLTKMGISETDFRGYFEHNGGLLRALAGRRA